MEITKDTKLHAIFKAHGHNKKVLDVFGISLGGFHPIRAVAKRFVTLERAARVHNVPLDEMIASLRSAIDSE